MSVKISKSRIQEIIKEELERIQEEEEKEQKLGTFGTERVTATGAKQKFKKRGEAAVDQADEYTNLERGIVQQLNDVLEQLAIVGEIDSGELRAQLQLIYKRLAKILKIIKAKGKGNDNEQ